MTASGARLALVAGEASGDLIAAQALSRLIAQRAQTGAPLSVVGIGGSALSAIGMDCWFSSERLAVRGYVEALSRLHDILSVRQQLMERLRAEPPSLFLGVDAPDFNLTVETRLRSMGVPTVHLVSPSIWAWRPERIHRISQAVDHMLCLFPFEPDCYKNSRVEAHYVGHPLADVIPVEPDRGQALSQLSNLLGEPLHKPVLAVLPGSRLSEIRSVGEAFLDAAIRLSDAFTPVCPVVSPGVRSAIERLPNLSRALACGLHLVGPEAAREGPAPLSHRVLEASSLALVASGTATLEAALFKVPQVIGYRVPPLTHWLMRRKALVQRVGLPNLLVEPDLVPECLQADCNGTQLAEAMRQWERPTRVADYQEKCARLHHQLRQDTAGRVASLLDDWLPRPAQ